MNDANQDLDFQQRHWGLRTILRMIKISVTTLTILLIFSIAGGMGIYFYFARDLPNIKTMADYKPPVVSEVFAADGTKVGEFWTERRLVTSLDKIPVTLLRAFLAAEDFRVVGEVRGVISNRV